MSVWSLLTLMTLVLVLPRLVVDTSRAQPRPREIHGFLRIVAVLNRLYCRLWHRFKCIGPAPLPAVGPAVLICNHTCGVDHMLLQASCSRLLGFMIAREYYNHKSIHWICRYIGCIPVDRDGRDFSATRAALRALAQGRVLPIFPEGRIVPESGRRLDPMKPGAAYLAIRAQAPVIPAFIWGTPPTNEIVPSLTTPSGARVIFGPPIDISDFPPRRAGDKAAQAEVCRRFEHALLTLQSRAFETNGDP